MDIGDRIKMLRTQQGLTLEEVGNRVGVGKSTVRKWESGQIANMRRDKIALLADALGVSAAYLMGWKEEAAPARPALPDAIPYTPMPLVRVAGAVRCGPGGLAIEEDLGYERADVPSPKDYIYLRATGDSMAPQICEGDLALVHLQPDVESGELAVVVIDGEEGMLKRVIKREGALILQSFNASVEPRIVVGEALNDVMIVGKVVQTVRKW